MTRRSSLTITELPEPSTSSDLATVGASDRNAAHSTACQYNNSHAFACCIVCDKILCHFCFSSHQLMDCIMGNIDPLVDFYTNMISSDPQRFSLCECRKWLTTFFCVTCNVATCRKCIDNYHRVQQHNYKILPSMVEYQIKLMHRATTEALSHTTKIMSYIDTGNNVFYDLKNRYGVARREINDTYKFFQFVIKERKSALLRELEKAMISKQLTLGIDATRHKTTIINIEQLCNYMKSMTINPSAEQALLLRQLLHKKLQSLLKYDLVEKTHQITFHSSYRKLQIAVKNSFGYIDLSARNPPSLENRPSESFPRDFSFSSTSGSLEQPFAINFMPIPRKTTKYHLQFGEFGNGTKQFMEPITVASNEQNEIIVADTNNHRVAIFDEEGCLKFHFGKFTKSESLLFNPDRVAVDRRTGDIIITEQWPVSQIRVFDQFGNMKKKFGDEILQRVRGVTVDGEARIIVVHGMWLANHSFDSSVVIFEKYGKLFQKLCCPRDLLLPNGIAVNNNRVIFISDYNSHCINALDYSGTLLFKIGGPVIIRHPVGVATNAEGHLLVFENDYNFKITIFSQYGVPLTGFKSEVKHTDFTGFALMNNGFVLACKSSLYVYREVLSDSTN